jgi:hypothetical protein
VTPWYLFVLLMKFGFRKTDGIKRLESEVSELFDVALAGGLCAQRRQSAKFVLRRVLFGITGTQVFAARSDDDDASHAQISKPVVFCRTCSLTMRSIPPCKCALA